MVVMGTTLLMQKKIIHYPTLKTMLAIEGVIRNSELALSRNKILDLLEKKVMRSTLNVSLEYMQNRGLILETKKGFIWTFNEKMEKLISSKKANFIEMK